MIDEACEEVTNILTKPHIAKMLKTASKYLSEHSEMSKKMMNELLETARNEGEICINNERYYRNMVNNLWFKERAHRETKLYGCISVTVSKKYDIFGNF